MLLLVQMSGHSAPPVLIDAKGEYFAKTRENRQIIQHYQTIDKLQTEFVCG